MSKFAIKGIVVPLIPFNFSLFCNPNHNSNPTPYNKLLANMEVEGTLTTEKIETLFGLTVVSGNETAGTRN